MFVGLHALLAHQTNTPELMLTEMEGDQFMKTAQNVMRHYSVQSTQKTLDWIAFGGCALGIYAPRFVAMRQRKKGERMQQPQPVHAPANSDAPVAHYVPSVVPGDPDEMAAQ